MLGVQEVRPQAVACPEGKSPTKRANSKPVMVATQGLGKQLVLRDGKLDGQDVPVFLDSGSETSIAKVSPVDPSNCTQQTVKVPEDGSCKR